MEESVMLKHEELESLIDMAINKTIELKSKKGKLMTRKDVAAFFKISPSTTYVWSNRGFLKPYGIGGRVYFKRDEVEKALLKLNHEL